MNEKTDAFTLIELLVVVALLFVLAGLFLPAISAAKEFGRRTQCVSNLRQLNLTLPLYAQDHEGYYPARQTDRQWPAQLLPYYSSPSLLFCPSDPKITDHPATDSADEAPRSYSLNGFGDPKVSSFDEESWPAFVEGPQRGTILEAAVTDPAETILLGETHGENFYVELKREAGSFVEVLELGRHGASRSRPAEVQARGGGANHAFADGSVRYLDFGKAICPINLWGVTDYYRTNYAICFF